MNDIHASIKARLAESDWQKLVGQIERTVADPQPRVIAQVFASLPRYFRSGAGEELVTLGEQWLSGNNLPLIVDQWPVVRLARVWLLTAIPVMEQQYYLQLIEPLFMYGEMEELAALYAALPIYHFPNAWAERCKEGIRSNIGLIRQAVMLGNAYPACFLDEPAWNQLVLKAFFTEEPVEGIVGIQERNNPRLAEALVDYAYERSAARRPIAPTLWRLVAPYLDERAFRLISRILEASQDQLEKEELAYACGQSAYEPARKLVMEAPWKNLAAAGQARLGHGWARWKKYDNR